MEFANEKTLENFKFLGKLMDEKDFNSALSSYKDLRKNEEIQDSDIIKFYYLIIAFGDDKLLKEMFQEIKNNNMDILNIYTIYFAIKNDNLNFVKSLLSKEFGLNYEEGELNFLQTSILTGAKNTFDYLIKNNPEMIKNDIFGNSLSQIAVLSGKTDMVDSLIDSKIDEANNKFMPIYASMYRKPEMLEYLASKGFDMSITKDGHNGIYWCLWFDLPEHALKYNRGDLYDKTYESVKILLNNGVLLADAIAKFGDIESISPLHRAAVLENKALFNLLLVACEQENNDWTIALDGPDLTNVSINKNFCIDKQDNKGATPIDYAVVAGNTDMVDHLIGLGAKLELANIRSALFEAIANNKFEMAKYLLTNTNVNPNIKIHKDENILTPTSLSIYKGQYDLYNYLVEKGADPNPLIDNNGNYLTHSLAKEGNLKAIKLLVDNKADINTKNKLGLTALHISDFYNDIEIVIELLKLGADVNSVNASGMNILHYKVNTKSIIDFMNEYGIDSSKIINQPNKDGVTPLLSQIIHNGPYSFENTKTLIMNNADIRFKTIENENIYHAIAFNGNPAYLSLVNTKDKTIDINLLDSGGSTPLMIAAKFNNYQLIKPFVEIGANLTEVDYEANNAFHYAAHFGSLEFFKELLRFNKEGAKTFNNIGLSPIDLATEFKNELYSVLDNYVKLENNLPGDLGNLFVD